MIRHPLLAAVVVLLAVFTVAHLTGAALLELARETYPPCAAEDSPGPCTWDAARQGNGYGRSFTVDRNGHVTYWTNGRTDR